MTSLERKQRIKELIVDRLNLKIEPSSIKDDANLFVSDDSSADSLGLDSVDALELAVGLMNEFGVEVSDDNMHIFNTVNSIDEFIGSYSTAGYNLVL